MEWTPTGWQDQRKALPQAPQENQEGEEAFRELRQFVLDVSREMSIRSPKVSITLTPEFNLKEITIDGFVA